MMYNAQEGKYGVIDMSKPENGTWWQAYLQADVKRNGALIAGALIGWGETPDSALDNLRETIAAQKEKDA